MNYVHVFCWSHITSRITLSSTSADQPLFTTSVEKDCSHNSKNPAMMSSRWVLNLEIKTQPTFRAISLRRSGSSSWGCLNGNVFCTRGPFQRREKVGYPTTVPERMRYQYRTIDLLAPRLTEFALEIAGTWWFHAWRAPYQQVIPSWSNDSTNEKCTNYRCPDMIGPRCVK